MPFTVGLDLGQSADYSALSVVQGVKQATGGGNFATYLHLRHLERYPLRTPYPDARSAVLRAVEGADKGAA